FGEGFSSANPLSTGRAERSYSGFDRPHAFSMNVIYDLPLFRQQSGFLGKALGGFQLNSAYVLASGRRFTPSQFLNQNFGGNFATYQDNTFQGGFVGLDAIRPFRGNPNADPKSVAITDVDASYFGFFGQGPYVKSPTGFYSLNALNAGAS